MVFSLFLKRFYLHNQRVVAEPIHVVVHKEEQLVEQVPLKLRVSQRRVHGVHHRDPKSVELVLVKR